MSAQVEEPRVKPVRRVLGGWALFETPWGAAVSIAALLIAAGGTLFWTFREGASSAVMPKADFAAPPQINAALAAAEAKLKEDPKDIAALVQLGLLRFQKGKDHYIDAINDLEQAREFGALDSRIFYCLGIMYQEEGLYSFAQDEYGRFLRNHPDDKEIRMALAKLLYQEGRFREAIGEYERLKYQHPDDSLIEENLGLSLWGAKLADRAVESFKRLKTMGRPQSRRAELYTGQVEFSQGRYQAALEHLLASLPPNDSEDIGVAKDKVYSALAMSYQKLGQTEEAKAAWQKTLAFAPGDLKAQAALRELNRRSPAKKPRSPKKP